jgi:uncharacterized protein YndB with AHSA1/START domain
MIGGSIPGEEAAAIVESIEIERRPEDVFSYLIDPSHLPEWQESVLSARLEGSGPPAMGSRMTHTRRVGRRERTITQEMTEYDAPRAFAFRGVEGPVRAIGKGTVEPLGDGARSRVTIDLDFEGHGIGKLLVPLVVRRQARNDLPRDLRNLKQRLESGAA